MHSAHKTALQPGPPLLAQLVYELLDAHDDTAQLASGFAGDPRWDAHLDYLRNLQRVGREVLACAQSPEPAHEPPPGP